MLRDLLSMTAMAAGGFCRWRMRVWHWRGELCADLSEWATTPASWAAIRNREETYDAS